MTLTDWFKAYVYIPLGGSRRGRVRRDLNILIVWALTGLWHGAGWNFVLWGLYFALLLIFEKRFLLKNAKWEKTPGWIRQGLTFLAVVPMLLYSVGYLGNVLIQGPGEWPDKHDFYGFLLWGWPIGIAIACGLVVLIWVLAVVLRGLNGKKTA